MNLSDVFVFKKVASTLSFTKAARELGISRSATSKQITRLESSLGVLLLNRTTRSVSLTEAGRIFDAHTSKIDQTIENAANLVRNSDLSPLGTVSVTLPSSLGAALMAPLATDFAERWPDLELVLHFDDSSRDLIAESLDLAIRISEKLPDSSLISRRLASTRRVLAASPLYLQKHGIPTDPTDLENYQNLGLGSAVKTYSPWKFKDHGKVIQPPMAFSLLSNNHLALVLAACLGSGIICIPEICIANELATRQLQIIPDLVCPEPYGVYALYPHRNAATKVKVLVDFIEDMLTKMDTLSRWTPLSERTTEITHDSDPDSRMTALGRNA